MQISLFYKTCPLTAEEKTLLSPINAFIAIATTFHTVWNIFAFFHVAQNQRADISEL